jgi:hypothetical protein
MGRSPGYDPLAYCIRRPMPAASRCMPGSIRSARFPTIPTGLRQPRHPRRPHITKRYGSHDLVRSRPPGHPRRALNVIMDVVRRYDIDGVHLDDYFYPYPNRRPRISRRQIPAQRRAYVDGFVSSLYSSR